MKYILIVLVSALLLQCKSLESQQNSSHSGCDVRVQVEYNRYIVAESVEKLERSVLKNTPIIPSRYTERYSPDTLYWSVGENFQGEYLRLSTKDSVFFYKALYSEPRIGRAAEGSLPINENLDVITITFANCPSIKVNVDKRLNFLKIKYKRSQNLFVVEQTNHVPQYR